MIPDYNLERNFSDWQIIYHLAGAITSLAPRFQPRNFQAIIDQFVEKFRSVAELNPFGELYYISCSYNELLTFLKDILMQIPQFQDLNLSERELKSGVNVDDPSRDTFRIITRYSSKPDPEDDFIDLDACIQNVVNGLYREFECFS